MWASRECAPTVPVWRLRTGVLHRCEWRPHGWLNSIYLCLSRELKDQVDKLESLVDEYKDASMIFL